MEVSGKEFRCRVSPDCKRAGHRVGSLASDPHACRAGLCVMETMASSGQGAPGPAADETRHSLCWSQDRGPAATEPMVRGCGPPSAPPLPSRLVPGPLLFALGAGGQTVLPGFLLQSPPLLRAEEGPSGRRVLTGPWGRTVGVDAASPGWSSLQLSLEPERKLPTRKLEKVSK